MTYFDNLLIILTILGSLTLFLYGMKLMSESLQRISGNRLRNLFSSIASNRFRAIFAGLFVTGVIQSSSAVTVMLVSFTNAGLFNLFQGLGIMMGANIGTTVTAWLVSYFGFHLDFNVVLLPILGIALPFMFLTGNRKRAVGEFVVGFALLFLGLQFMKNALPEVSTDSLLVNYLTGIQGSGIQNIALFAVAGLIITLIIQSSSATITLTMVMCHNGWITYEAAAAMILGENVGTTV
ncbi:MAG: Na/Pi cotransporter family protein, partial [Lentimicrobium sp.]|nr:Na/Pi cotransporter family protein [Lentimicrobium sp.]